MKVLVLGDGAREHAIAWKYSTSRRLSGLFIAPGNAGTAAVGTNVADVTITDPDAVLHACRKNNIDLVFVGGEEPLSAGVVDCLTKNDIVAIGPHQAAAQLESSKSFAKEFMRRNHIPTAEAHSFADERPFRRFIEANNRKLVVKKSGLAAGKGVLESDNRGELLSFGSEILRSDTVVVEEFLTGHEVSVFALTDGNSYILLPSAVDYKKAGDGNTGRNTGGMGALAPVPWLGQETADRIETEIVAPTFAALRREELSYRGILYFGIMLTASGPYVLEYNIRFGDPEAQVILPLIQTDFGAISEAVAQGTLEQYPLHFSRRTALGVVVASAGYPGPYERGIPVSKLPVADYGDTFLFHASTRDIDGTVHTGGGRCFTAVALGRDLLEARGSAYKLADAVSFNGAWKRSDIGARVFE